MHLAALPILVTLAMLCPASVRAQVFSADYGLARAASTASLPASAGGKAFQFGGVRVGPLVQADARYSGAGLSLAAGANWFAQVSVGRSLQHDAAYSAAVPTDALRVAGGYRWADGQSLSLQVTGGRGPDRLGLAVSYDWPRYFVRLSYDTGLAPIPQDKLRLSAGVRF